MEMSVFIVPYPPSLLSAAAFTRPSVVPLLSSSVSSMARPSASLRAKRTRNGRAAPAGSGSVIGAAVVTSAQAVNAAANTVLTFGEAGDVVDLLAVSVAGALRWRVVANDGVVLSTP